VLLQPVLQTPIQEWETEMNEILATPLECFDVFELYLLRLLGGVSNGTPNTSLDQNSARRAIHQFGS